MNTIILNLSPVIKLTSNQFYQLCVENPDLRLERTKEGEVIIMAPTGGETGKRNVKLVVQLALWNDEIKLGEVFDSSTGFTLPNGSDRSPDVAWVEKSRWDGLTPEQKEKFIPLCPDFLIELLSPSDSLKKTQEKMQEYLDNGLYLCFLINRRNKQVEIYRPGQKVEVLESPTTLSGENILPAFVLSLKQIWD
ncbi:MAG: Uma2 family endonuclease [Chamaesiphon sp.]